MTTKIKPLTPEQKKAFLDKCWVPNYTIGFGIWQFTCFTPEFCGPIGFVWIIPAGGQSNSAEVVHSYVLPQYRRRGVRTLINQEILKQFRIVRTWEGSKEGGEAFMKAAGYTHDPARGDWYLLRREEGDKSKREQKRRTQRGKKELRRTVAKAST